MLVDCDLRNPRLHKVFSLDNRNGLTQIFSNGTMRAHSHRIEGQGFGLDLVTSGPIPPNPAELVGGERMASWIQQSASEYDCLIIDSPPSGPVSDPALLSRHVDGVILVLELGKTSMRALRRAHDHLSKVGAPMLGIVLNGVRLNPRGYYYYYSRYGYVAGGGRPAAGAGNGSVKS
jgi:capsular exopolysaccharide synthesis family protein